MGKSCLQCLRILIIIFNFIFVLLGLAIVALSVYVYLDATARGMADVSGIQDSIHIALYVLMAIGGLTVIIGTFGCCGAYHQSQCLLGTYFGCLFVIFAVEIAAGTVGFIFRDKIKTLFGQKIGEYVNDYHRKDKHSDTNHAIDLMEMFVHCCGAVGPQDYEGQIPSACCDRQAAKLQHIECNHGNDTIPNSIAYQTGCEKGYIDFIMRHSVMVLAVLISVAALEVIGLIISIAMCCCLRREQPVGYNSVDT